MTDDVTYDITCDVCTASSDWVCRRCYDAMSAQLNRYHQLQLVAQLQMRERSAATDAEEYELRRVLTGALNDAISAQKATATTVAVDEGRRTSAYRTAIARLDELRDAHNRLQSLQVDYSHARMLLKGWVESRKTGDVGDEEFFLRRAREYFEVRE